MFYFLFFRTRQQRARWLSAKPVPPPHAVVSSGSDAHAKRAEPSRAEPSPAEPSRAVLQCNFKMTAEEASGASEEDDSDLCADVCDFSVGAERLHAIGFSVLGVGFVSWSLR